MNRRELAELVVTTVLEHCTHDSYRADELKIILDNRKQTLEDVERAILVYEDAEEMEE